MAVPGPVLKYFCPRVRFSGPWTDPGITLLPPPGRGLLPPLPPPLLLHQVMLIQKPLAVRNSNLSVAFLMGEVYSIFLAAPGIMTFLGFSGNMAAVREVLTDFLAKERQQASLLTESSWICNLSRLDL